MVIKRITPFIAALMLAMTMQIRSTSAQGVNPGAGISPQGPPAMPVFIQDINGRPYNQITPEDIEGSPFLFDDWQKGDVFFSDAAYVKNIELKFNVHMNLLYFKRNNGEFEFVKPVKEFFIRLPATEDTLQLVFRNGFPAINNISPAVFYEVLADGAYQLLKYRYKKLSTIKRFSLPEQKKLEEGEDLYLFSSKENSLIKLSKKRNTRLEEIRKVIPVVDQLITKDKIDIMNEKSLRELIKKSNS